MREHREPRKEAGRQREERDRGSNSRHAWLRYSRLLWSSFPVVVMRFYIDSCLLTNCPADLVHPTGEYAYFFKPGKDQDRRSRERNKKNPSRVESVTHPTR